MKFFRSILGWLADGTGFDPEKSRQTIIAELDPISVVHDPSPDNYNRFLVIDKLGARFVLTDNKNKIIKQ